MTKDSNVKLKEFFLVPTKETIPKDYGTFFGQKEIIEYDPEEAQGFVTEIKEHIEATENKLPSFWYIEMKKDIPIYSNSSLKIIRDYFEGELVKIVLDNSGIIAISSNKFDSVKKKLEKNIPKYVAQYLNKKITRWDSELKVSKVLLQKIDINESSGIKTAKANISIFSLPNKQEELMVKENLSEYFKQKEIKATRNDLINIFVAELNKTDILDLIKKEFIEYIDPVMSCEVSQIQTQQPSQSKPQLIEVDQSLLGEICVIDTGVSSALFSKYLRQETLFDEKEDLADNEGHGTLVSSIAMFGKDIFNQESLIKPNAKVISYNIQDFDKIDVPLSSAISKIVEIEKDKTNIFNLSINYPYPPETEAELGVYVNEAMKIDRYIQLNNIVLVNSAGNVGKKLLKRRIKEPDKNEYLSVSSPAFSPNVFSVGSVEQDQKNLSLFGLVGSPFNHKSENNLSPPQIFAFGGDTNGNKVWCLSKNDSVCSEVGTSFSAPLVSLACRKAMDLFFPNFCKNAESVKAMVLNSCTKVEKKTDVVFVLDDPLDIGLCHDSLKFNFEGKLRPEHKAKDIKKKLVDTHKGEFYVPKEAQSIEFTLVYSHNYYLRRLSEDCVFPKIKISGISKNSKREIINSNLKTPNGQIVYGEVAFKKNHHGKWYFELYFDGKGIPPEFRSSTLIRYGLAIKINLGSDSSTLLRKTYSEAVKEMHLKEIKDPLEEQVTEKILSNIQTFQKHTK